MIAIMVITHSRVELLRKCVENVLLRTTATSEIVIWDNASTDGTPDYLATLTDPRIRVMRSPTNVGMNGYGRSFRMTTAPFVVELDDDVVDAPAGWDRMLLDAYERLPEIGFLSADIVDDPHDPPAHYRYRVRPHEYHFVEVNGVPLLEGPAWGGCAITSRRLAADVGGFPERPGEVFWLEDAEYLEKIAKRGYRGATLASLKVHHTGGPHYTVSSPEKEAYWQRHYRRQAQKATIKRVLLQIPLVPQLNARFGWFRPPAES
jgi:rhamnopyranosyl-N-acetylglucosaminyl-diphospho-decaprenol beta-1,3/1,4-galactofuranosyltransferase